MTSAGPRVRNLERAGVPPVAAPVIPLTKATRTKLVSSSTVRVDRVRLSASGPPRKIANRDTVCIR
jgi:hypothetical protein